MAQVIIFSDTILWGEVGNLRYMGAYAVAAATRRAGFETVVIDYFTRHPDFFNYLENFLNSETLTIGMSSTFLAPFLSISHIKKQRSEGLDHFYTGDLWFREENEFKEWFEKLKSLIRKKSPRAKLVLGGVKSQFALWRPELYSVFDCIVLGAADHTFPKYVKSVMDQTTFETETHNGTVILNNKFDLENKTCPPMEWTKNDAVQPQESLPLEIARGCVFNCKFCHYDKKESFKKEIEQLKSELIRNHERFGTDTYHFCDDCFNDHPQKVETICNMFLNLPFKIEWVAYARVDVAIKFPKTIEMMVASGARGLYWGLESFNADAARKAGKGTPPEKVKEFLKEFSDKYRHQCLVEGSFITGLPGEDSKSLQSTLDWLCENPVLDFVTVGALGLMPYVPSLDKKVFDYADYSRNPEKYGFTKVQFKPNFWEHETMNSIQARDWAEKMMTHVRSSKPKSFVKSIWQYAHFKTLGYSKDEIFMMSRADLAWDKAFNAISQKFDQYLKNYWSSLLINQNANCTESVASSKIFCNWPA